MLQRFDAEARERKSQEDRKYPCRAGLPVEPMRHINAGKPSSQVRDTLAIIKGMLRMRMIAATGLALALLVHPAIIFGQTAPAKPAATAAATPAASTLTSTYRVNPGDQLQIYVWGDERLQRQLTVLPDGTFAFPLAGTIQAAGRTPNEIEAELSKLLAPQYKGVDQQVTVSVQAPTGMQISIIGKVRAPGNFSPTRYINVLNALAMAGGPTDFADIGNIIILRTVGGRPQVIHTHMANIFKGKPSDAELSASGVPQIVPGDTVVVP
jgi:polysaccharide biosynthesis/export protein